MFRLHYKAIFEKEDGSLDCSFHGYIDGNSIEEVLRVLCNWNAKQLDGIRGRWHYCAEDFEKILTLGERVWDSRT